MSPATHSATANRSALSQTRKTQATTVSIPSIHSRTSSRPGVSPRSSDKPGQLMTMSRATMSTPTQSKSSGNTDRLAKPTRVFTSAFGMGVADQAAPGTPAPFLGRASPASARAGSQKQRTTIPDVNFDDFCLDLTRSSVFQQALHTRRADSASYLRDDVSPQTSGVFRSLSISDPKLTGHPIRFRSRHFSLSPRGLRVGDCEFLNLPTPGEGVNLSTRADIDGRPAFVLEIVGTLCDASTGKAVWVSAGQVDVTDVIRNMARLAVMSKEDEASAREEKARLEREKKKLADARRVKEELLPYPANIVAFDNAKYFSDSSDDLYDDQGSDSDYDSDESTTLSVPDTSPSRSSLGSLPNNQFVFRANPADNSYANDSKPRQVSFSLNTTEDAEEDDGEDIWLSLAKEEALSDYPFSSSRSTPLKWIKPSSTNTPDSFIPKQSLHDFSHLVNLLRILHRDSFVLKRPSPAQSSTLPSTAKWITAWSSPSLLTVRKQFDAFAMLSKNHEQTMQTLEGALKREKEFRLEVRWGQDGEGARKWLYAVPMVRGAGESKGGVMGSGEKCWMCFVVGVEVANLWSA